MFGEKGSASSDVTGAHAITIYGLGHQAWNDWILGFPDRARLHINKERELAEETQNPFNLVHYCGFAGFLYQCRGDIDTVIDVSSEKTRISEDNAFPLNLYWAQMLRGWVISEQEESEKGLQLLEEGLAVWKAVGMVVFIPYWNSLICELLIRLSQLEKSLEVSKT